MKIVIASAGLANMMFSYALVVALRKRGIKTLLFVSKANAAHHGYELESVFKNVRPFEGLNKAERFYYKVLGKVRSWHIRSFYPSSEFLLLPYREHKIPECVLYYPDVFERLDKNEFFDRQCQSYRYYEGCRDDLCHSFSFDHSMLSPRTVEIEKQIDSCNSVSVHVRRGDYLQEANKGLGSVCDELYYCRAIDYIKSKVENPHFFIFSDDKEWVKANMNLPNTTIVDHNYGRDSWQDMYLMSRCQNNILANSSFSWWAAYLNQSQTKIVVTPKRWWADFEKDDVVPNEWHRL